MMNPVIQRVQSIAHVLVVPTSISYVRIEQLGGLYRHLPCSGSVEEEDPDATFAHLPAWVYVESSWLAWSEQSVNRADMASGAVLIGVSLEHPVRRRVHTVEVPITIEKSRYAVRKTYVVWRSLWLLR